MNSAVSRVSSGYCAAPANENEMQVGARQASMRLPQRGGGYPDVCTIFGAAVPAPNAAGADDPRIDELRIVGIPRIWIRVARVIGFDAFVSMWQVLMQATHVDQRSRVVVPNYTRYLRFQRNRLIRQLVSEGHGVDEIREVVKQVTGEVVSESHIRHASRRS